MFSKTCTFLYFYILSRLFSFWNPFPPPPPSPPFSPSPSPFPTFFSLPHPRFHKPYPQSKTFNIRALPSGAVFCSNAVLITTPSSFMQYFGFFDVLPSAPTTSGMTLMLLMFHIFFFDFSL